MVVVMSKALPLSWGAAALLLVLAAVLIAKACLRSKDNDLARKNPASTVSKVSQNETTVDLAPSQLNAIKLESVTTSLFSEDREAVGNIDYDEDLSVQVSSPYPGRIINALAELGDEVEKGQALYTIDSPDLIQAESSLIGDAATFALTSKELARVKELYGTNGVSQREIEQATSDQQTAEGALKGAQDAVRLFGKTEAEVEHILATRQIDPVLVVRSPIRGRVTARNAQPGLLVQPGTPPAPYAVADLSTKWMVANVSESDSPLFHTGQPVRTRVMAYPGRIFEGKISRIGAAVDPNTHRVMLRCDISDPRDELRPGMLASFLIRVQDPVESLAIPMNGVVRNGDGTMAAWVTTDRRRFVQRILKLGLQDRGRYQVMEGLHPGELAVTDGAIFLSNMLQAPPMD
jgi:cobalt-zinc-cadmium efflux system membrane fusion protein